MSASLSTSLPFHMSASLSISWKFSLSAVLMTCHLLDLSSGGVESRGGVDLADMGVADAACIVSVDGAGVDVTRGGKTAGAGVGQDGMSTVGQFP